MPTIDFLKSQFPDGYDSGDILAKHDERRLSQEKAIGGSFQDIFNIAVKPYLKPDSVVMELGAGAGSWSRAILEYIPNGMLHALDFQDLKPWIKPELYNGRLRCHKVHDNSFDSIEDATIDYFWSFGVLCHNNQDDIRQILTNAAPKMKPGAYSSHEYGDWDKLEKFGWEKTVIPPRFKKLPDNEIWWPRNNKSIMRHLAEGSGWNVEKDDLDIVSRDGIILLRRP